jgi:Flp pilus assembly pilin Flp
MNFADSEKGQGLVEYALIIVLLAIVSIVALNFLAGGITEALYNNIISSL